MTDWDISAGDHGEYLIARSPEAKLTQFRLLQSSVAETKHLYQQTLYCRSGSNYGRFN